MWYGEHFHTVLKPTTLHCTLRPIWSVMATANYHISVIRATRISWQPIGLIRVMLPKFMNNHDCVRGEGPRYIIQSMTLTAKPI